MADAVEEEEKRVPAELDDVAAVPRGDPDQALETAADDEDELLGAFLPLLRESLGERRESGEVGRDEGRVELAVRRRIGPRAGEQRQIRRVTGRG